MTTPVKLKALPRVLLIFMLLIGCDQKADQSDEQILATVGETRISAKEFINSYNAGSSLLKDIDHPQQSFLNAMIAEELLAAELKKDTSFSSNVRISKALHLLKQELVVEQMFKTEVHDQIRVDEEEIKRAIIQSQLSVRANFIICDDKQSALHYLELLDNGYDFEVIQAMQVDDLFSRVIFDSTDYVRDGELPEPLNSALFDLEVNEYSDIIPVGKAYVIALSNDRLQELIDPQDFQKYHDRFYKVLDYRKRLEKSRIFVKNFMDPLDIKIEGDIFAYLVNTLYDLYVNLPANQLTQMQPAQTEYLVTAEEIFQELNQRGEETAVRSNQGDISLQLLLEQLLLKPFKIESQNKADFASELRQEIAITLRDYYLEKEGVKRGYDQETSLQDELAAWEEKLMVQAFIEDVKTAEFPDEQELKNYLEAQNLLLEPGSARWNQLRQRLINQRTKLVLDTLVDSLKSTVDIEVFSGELSKIELDRPMSKREPDTYFFKLGLPYLRSAFATPDPIWGL